MMENQYLNAAFVSFENVRKRCWQYHETALKIRREKCRDRKSAFVIGSKLNLDHCQQVFGRIAPGKEQLTCSKPVSLLCAGIADTPKNKDRQGTWRTAECRDFATGEQSCQGGKQQE